ncbi:Ig-like domain-containing protein, partial [Yoonia sp.]|uniref:Ig-like domain-containing protein n=1 Tax=Yoonia sp. TaxID=2212373 RepID=UPI003975A482
PTLSIDQPEVTAGGEDMVLSGVTESGATVKVTLAGQSERTATVEGNSWTLTIPESELPEDGVYEITVEAEDLAGNTSAPKTANATIDTTPPTLSIDQPEVTAGGEDMVLSGVTESGATVRVTLAGQSERTATVEDNSWTLTIPESELPADGVYEVTVEAEDLAGNTSAPKTANVTIDTTSEIEIDLPLDNSPGDYGVINADMSSNWVLTGKAEAGSQIVLSITDGTTVTLPAVDADSLNGNWSVPIPVGKVPEDGEYSIIATATDVYGNVDTDQVAVTIDRNSGITVDNPDVTEDGIINATEASIGFDVTGTADAGATVTVTLPNTTTQEVTTGADGHWTLSVTQEMIGDESSGPITASAIDPAGNPSETVAVNDGVDIKVDTVIPNAPRVEEIYSNSSNDINQIELTLADGINIYSVDDLSLTDTTLVSEVRNSSSDNGQFSLNPDILAGSDFMISIGDDSDGDVNTVDPINTVSTLVLRGATNQEFDGSELFVSGFNVVGLDLTYITNAEIVLGKGDIAGLATNSDQLLITGDSADSVDITGASRLGTEDVGGITFDVFNYSDTGERILVEESIQLQIT